MQVHNPVRRRWPNTWLSFVFWCLLIVLYDTGLQHHDSHVSHTLQGTCSSPPCSQSQNHFQDCTPQLPDWKGNSTPGSPESTGCASGPSLEICLGWASFSTTSSSFLDNGQLARSPTMAVPALQTEVQSSGDLLPILWDAMVVRGGRPWSASAVDCTGQPALAASRPMALQIPESAALSTRGAAQRQRQRHQGWCQEHTQDKGQGHFQPGSVGGRQVGGPHCPGSCSAASQPCNTVSAYAQASRHGDGQQQRHSVIQGCGGVAQLATGLSAVSCLKESSIGGHIPAQHHYAADKGQTSSLPSGLGLVHGGAHHSPAETAGGTTADGGAFPDSTSCLERATGRCYSGVGQRRCLRRAYRPDRGDARGSGGARQGRRGVLQKLPSKGCASGCQASRVITAVGCAYALAAGETWSREITNARSTAQAGVFGRPDYVIAPWLSLSQSQGSLRPSDMAQGYCPNSFDPTVVSIWGHSCSYCPDFVTPAQAQLSALQLRFSLSFPQLFATWGWDPRILPDDAVQQRDNSHGPGHLLFSADLGPSCSTAPREHMDSPLAEGPETSMLLRQRSRAPVQGPACCGSGRSDANLCTYVGHASDLSEEILVHNHTLRTGVVQPFSDMQPEGFLSSIGPSGHTVLSVPSCLRSLPARAHASRGKKVRFCPEVSFWFPVHDQLVLPFASHQKLRAHPGGSCRSRVPHTNTASDASRSVMHCGSAPTDVSCRTLEADAPAVPILRLADFLSPFGRRLACFNDSFPQDVVTGAAKTKARSRPGRAARAKAKALAEQARNDAQDFGPVVANSVTGGSDAGSYASFDSVHGVRVRPRQRHWHPEQHVWDAITSAHFPGRPAGRNLVYTVPGYPIPQAAVTRDHGWEDFRTVVVDLRTLNCDIEVVDVPVGATGRSVVGMLGPDCSPQRLAQALQQGQLACNCNGLPHQADLRLPPDVDVLALIPGGFSGDSHASLWQTEWDADNHPAVNLHEAPHSAGASTLPQRTQVYLSIDSIFGIRYRARQALWSADHCCQDAVVSATYLPQARGRVLVSGLHRLPQPQVVVFSDDTTNQHRTVVFDLRPWGADPVAVTVDLGLPWRSALLNIPQHALPSGFSLALAQSAIALQVDGRPTHLDSLVLGLVDVAVPEATLSLPQRPTWNPVSSILDVGVASRVRSRPATPPIPRANRWGQASSENAATSTATPGIDSAVSFTPGLRLCTVFDILRQVEFVRTPACRSGSALLDWAKQRAQHLGRDVQGRVIISEIEGLPSFQVCIHSAVHASYTVTPWRLPNARREICTVPVERSACAFRAAIQLETDCGLDRSQHSLVAKGISQVRVNGRPVADPFAPNAFVDADTASLVSANERLRKCVPECIWHLPAGRAEAHTHLMLHRQGRAPVTVPCPVLLPPADMANALAREGHIPPSTRLQLPWACPHLPGVGPHFIVLDCASNSHLPLVVVDLRRVAVPPYVMY